MVIRYADEQVPRNLTAVVDVGIASNRIESKERTGNGTKWQQQQEEDDDEIPPFHPTIATFHIFNFQFQLLILLMCKCPFFPSFLPSFLPSFRLLGYGFDLNYVNLLQNFI